MADIPSHLLKLGLIPIPASDEPDEESLEDLSRELAEKVGREFWNNQVLKGTAKGAGVGVGIAFLINPILGAVSVTALAANAFAIAQATVPALCTALGAWLQARYGRKVRLKVGDIEAEARTKEEVEQLIVRAQEIQCKNEPKKIHEP